MRMRNRTVYQGGGGATWTISTYDSDTGISTQHTNPYRIGVRKHKISTITDDISRFPRRSLSSKRSDPRFSRLVTESNWPPVRECYHSNVSITYPDQQVVYGDSHIGSLTISTNASFTGAGYAEWLAFSSMGDPYNYFVGSPKRYADDPFLDPDWFHLIDRFDEKCDQLIPSSFLLGEDLVQSDIFVDAIKTVINPTRAVRLLLHAAKHRAKEFKGKRLRDVARMTAKDISNLDLGYNFGVKPAIDDIRQSLDAHKKVSDRLAYLRQHNGGFVPIRVRQDLLSNFSNDDVPPSSPTPPESYRLLDSKYTQACIGCWGRVRNDSPLREKWRAYYEYFGLNKVIGLGWELIPFSFVVDWFTNAQERINHLTRIRLGSPFSEFRSLTASLKYITEESLWIPGSYYDRGLNLYVATPDRAHKVMTVKTSSYNRWTKIPETSGVVDLSTLGLFHALTSGALIVQRKSS